VDTIFCKTSPTDRQPKPLRIRLFETPRDQRLDFVVSVLDKIAESRFGPGCTLIEIERFEEVFENRVMFDLTAKCHVHCKSPHASNGVTRKLASSVAAVDLSFQDLAVRTATAQIIQYRSNSPP